MPDKPTSERVSRSLCPLHGWDVRVDEDGCCVGCGADAFGDGADQIADQIATLERELAEARQDLCEARIDRDDARAGRQKYVDAHASVKGGLVEMRKQRDEMQRASGCLLAGPGRGDCENYIGMPAVLSSLTTNEYGRPYGWCEVCWRGHQLAKSQAECERLQEQTAENEAAYCAMVFKWKARAEALQGLVDSIGPRCKKCGRLNWRVSTTARHAREAEPTRRSDEWQARAEAADRLLDEWAVSTANLEGRTREFINIARHAREAEPTTEGGSSAESSDDTGPSFDAGDGVGRLDRQREAKSNGVDVRGDSRTYKGMIDQINATPTPEPPAVRIRHMHNCEHQIVTGYGCDYEAVLRLVEAALAWDAALGKESDAEVMPTDEQVDAMVKAEERFWNAVHALAALDWGDK